MSDPTHESVAGEELSRDELGAFISSFAESRHEDAVVALSRSEWLPSSAAGVAYALVELAGEVRVAQELAAGGSPITAEQLEAFRTEYLDDLGTNDPTIALREDTWHPRTPVEVAFALTELARELELTTDLLRTALNFIGELRRGEVGFPSLRAKRIELIDEEGIVHASIAVKDGAPVITTRSDPQVSEEPKEANLRVITGGDYDSSAVNSLAERLEVIEESSRAFAAPWKE